MKLVHSINAVAAACLAFVATAVSGFCLPVSSSSRTRRDLSSCHRSGMPFASSSVPNKKITAALYLTKAASDTVENGDFEEFAKRKQLRSWLSATKTASVLSDIQLEVMAQSMKERKLNKGEDLVRGGDEATECFVVSDGTFESYEYDKDGKERKLFDYSPGSFVGIISYANQSPYLYSVRATSDEASTWYLDKKSMDEILGQKKDLARNMALSAFTQEGSQFANYLEDYLGCISALTSFRLFKKLNKNDLRQLAARLTERSFTFGENVMIAGESDDTDMYFIKSGTYQALDATGRVIKTYNLPNEYFGEIGFFLQRPRSATVRVSSPDGILYSLARKDLDDIVDEDIFGDDNIALLAEQYKDAGLLDKYKEVLEYLAIKSRPKKKPVSLHSTVSIIAAGAYLASYQPFIHIGTDKDGFISFFDFYQPLSIDACHQIQISVVLLAISGIMGYFRIPPNAPAARRLPFTLATLSNVFFALVLTSSLNALPAGYWQFDAFSGAGKAAIGLAFIVEEYFVLSALDNALCGPEAGMSSTPGANGRASNIFFASLIYFFVTGAQAPLVAPVFFSDLTSYQASMSAAFQTVNMPALDFHSFATAVGFVSFLQLVATLQFEKKLSEMQGALALVLLFLAFNADAIVATYKTVFRPDLLPIIENTNNYLPGLISQNYISEIVTVITSLVFLKAAWKTFVVNDKKV